MRGQGVVWIPPIVFHLPWSLTHVSLILGSMVHTGEGGGESVILHGIPF